MSVTANLDRQSAHSKLAGVGTIIEDCKRFCLLSFMVQSNRKRVNGGEYTRLYTLLYFYRMTRQCPG